MTMNKFQEEILAGIPAELPEVKPYDPEINHAPKRKDILTEEEKVLALKNALRYFPERHHAVLAKEFAEELKKYGRIYMYRFRPSYEIYARPIDEYPAKSRQAAAIMAMIQNNLDPRVAQHPHELIIYGGNGAIFQNWAQYRLVMQYLATMTDEQTLVMYSGHPLGLFPSHKDAPRVIVTNGMVIPNYSKPDHWEKFNALGVSQYGQMTAGSYMYIGPQGIVHGTTITVMNAARKVNAKDSFASLGMTSYQIQKILSVLVLAHWEGDFLELFPGDPAVAEGDFFQAGDLEALALFDHFDIGRGFGERLVRAGVQPGEAAAEGLDEQSVVG